MALVAVALFVLQNGKTEFRLVSNPVEFYPTSTDVEIYNRDECTSLKYRPKAVGHELYEFAMTLVDTDLAPTTRRTVDRILMMNPGGTMTTEIVRYSSPDSYVKNDVFVLPESSRVPNVEVGAVGWITGSAGGVRAGHHECFHAVGAHVNQNIPDHRMWLLACHSAWQADNRIIRHRKLWSSLQARGLTIPDGRQIDERMQVGRDGIRWYGAVEVAIEELAYAADIVDEEPSSYVVSLSRLGESELSNLIESGWDRVDVGPSPDVLRKIVSADGIVLWPVGAFDESEVGVVAFTQPNILRRLAVL